MPSIMQDTYLTTDWSVAKREAVVVHTSKGSIRWPTGHFMVPSTPVPKVVLFGWWAHWDSNPEPKDYAYHFGFRRRIP